MKNFIATGNTLTITAEADIPGYHLYYPSRKHPSPAFSLLLDRLRYRG